jgi:hypothetical protein
MGSKIATMALAAGMVFGAAGIASAQNDVQQKSGTQTQMQKTTPGTSGTEAGTRSTEPGTKMENRASGASGTSGQAPVGTTQPGQGGMKKADEQKK